MSGDTYDPNSVDAVLARIEQRQIANGEKLDVALKRIDGHDGKIDAIEKKQWWLNGATAVVAFLASKLIGGK